MGPGLEMLETLSENVDYLTLPVLLKGGYRDHEHHEQNDQNEIFRVNSELLAPIRPLQLLLGALFDHSGDFILTRPIPTLVLLISLLHIILTHFSSLQFLFISYTITTLIILYLLFSKPIF